MAFHQACFFISEASNTYHNRKLNAWHENLWRYLHKSRKSTAQAATMNYVITYGWQHIAGGGMGGGGVTLRIRWVKKRGSMKGDQGLIRRFASVRWRSAAEVVTTLFWWWRETERLKHHMMYDEAIYERTLSGPCAGAFKRMSAMADTSCLTELFIATFRFIIDSLFWQLLKLQMCKQLFYGMHH